MCGHPNHLLDRWDRKWCWLPFISQPFGREPDDFLGLLTFGMSMGQWLSLPMILAGIGMAMWAVKRDRQD